MSPLSTVRWLVAKDLAILRRSPLLVGILVLYPVALALLIGVALASPPAKPRVAIYSGVAAGHGRLAIGGSHLDITAYVRQLLTGVTPVTAPSEADAIADVRSGRVQAAIIVPAGIVAQIDSLISSGAGSPTIRLVLNDRNPLEREVVDSEIESQVDQVQGDLSQALLATALSDLHTVVAGGPITFAGVTVDLLGLHATNAIISAAIPRIDAAGLGPRLAPQLRRVRSFADIAGEGLSFASPVLGQLHSPLSVDKVELSGSTTPTAAYGVAIAVAAAELFLALLLAAALLALERADGVYSRLVRGPATPSRLLAAKILLAGLAGALVALAMSAVVSRFVGVDWGRFPLWVAAGLVAGAAFAALGVAVGALAREVSAASLLAILVGLPVAFLGLVPAQAVAPGVGGVLSAISFVFPFRAGLQAIANALTATSPGIGGPLVHLAVLAVIYAVIARLALRRFAAV